MQCNYTTWLVSDLQDDERDGFNSVISLKVEALEGDLFKMSVQMRR